MALFSMYGTCVIYASTLALVKIELVYYHKVQIIECESKSTTEHL